MFLRLVIPAFAFWLTLFLPVSEKGQSLSSYADNLKKAFSEADNAFYQQLGEPSIPETVFKSSLDVYRKLKKEKQIVNHRVITLIDFTKPSHEKRLFVIDLEAKKILFKSLVAHGRNSGEHYATSFSNMPQSHQSSLGFYLTGEPYTGRHGYSLCLDGLEKGINDNARKRAVVVHGASYVSYAFIDAYGRLGRSFGCPALPEETASAIIDVIQNRSLLFIYSDDTHYMRDSRLFNSFLSFP